ncbi:hypothetical protein BC332_11620 [Capsicum chinense]|nr:hypothetical protein BC332_11620 [Capsicum chinense]
MTGKLNCVIVSVDGSEESMNALNWALDNIKLKPHDPDDQESQSGCFVILHVQSPPSIAAGLNPKAIPFGGPSDIEVPAFTAAIEAHQKRITQAILDHALEICAKKNVSCLRLPTSHLLYVNVNLRLCTLHAPFTRYGV